MASKVVYFKSIGEVTFFRNRRSKSIKITIKPDNSVLISYPFFISEKEVMGYLAENELWIKERQFAISLMRRRYKAGDVIETKFYKIELRTGPELKAKSSHSTIQLFYPDFSTEQGHKVLEDFMEKIYLVEAWLILPPRLEELASQHGFRYNKVTIRDNRRNWGSCSSANNISLNMQMMKLPDELIDYILLHELVHTEIKDHSARFWKKLDECTGFRARELAQEVKKYSTYTL